jgi:flagellar protein FlaF
VAVGELIGAAIGILLLVIVAYVLIGSTISTAEIVASAQRDLMIMHEARFRTGITVTNATSGVKDLEYNVTFMVNNTGSEIIPSLNTMDVFITWPTGAPVWYKFGDGSTGTWKAIEISPDVIHPNQLDPGESLTGVVEYLGDTKPTQIQIVTGNGVYSSKYI